MSTDLRLKITGIIDRFCKILGVVLIISGLLLNQWVIKFLSQGAVRFEEIEKRVFLIIFQIFLAILGVLLLRYKRIVLVNALLVFCSILFAFGALEIGLKFLPSNLDQEAPKWIPYEQKTANLRVNQKHQLKARANRYGFNDREHAYNRSPGVVRIAVLGDSFVWGVGVEEHVIWTRKLEQMLNQGGVKTEILHWGKPGWSTLDQYNFLKADGVKYEFDFLVVGFVVNDPVMDGTDIVRFIYNGGIVDRLIVQPLSRYLFPNAISMSVDLVNAFFDAYFEYGYPKWLQKVYQEENLKKYEALLTELSRYCKSRGIRLLFVMTPENHNPMLQQRFEQIIPLLKNAGIEYLDLYPVVYRQLQHIPNRKLWGNPADGHPGDMVTDVYARFVYRYLLDHKYVEASGKMKD